MMDLRTSTLPRFFLAAALLCAAAPGAAQSLRGSNGSVDRMFEHAVDNGIYFYKTGRGIRQAAEAGRFVRLRSGRDYVLHGVSYPYVRPTTRTFVERLARQYRSACGERLVITSAARPRSMSLLNSVRKTVHPTGMAVDLRRSNRRRCRDWLRATLLSLERRRVVEATEEKRPPHFHVAVFPEPYRRYVSGRSGSTPSGRGDATRYRVRAGDSLWTIARRHRTTVDRLKAANGLRSSTVRIGQVLVIPSS